MDAHDMGSLIQNFVLLLGLTLNLNTMLSLSFFACSVSALNLRMNGSKGIRPSTKSYNYFAYGSNVCKSTMENLRGIQPLASCPAILPGHELRFNIPGIPLLEPSWASVEPCDEVEKVVHGVLYKLTEEDFTTVCRSEGVPIGYLLHRCRPIPYLGDGCNAGLQALLNSKNNVLAYTLRAPLKMREKPSIPPSRSYLNVIIRGAKEFKIDQSYIDYLESIETGLTIIGNGTAEAMLEQAEKTSKDTIR